MADTTNIQWCDSPDGTQGATWNIITGCDFADDSCHGCYAALLAATRLKNIDSRKGLAEMRNGIPVWTGEVRFNEQWLEQPLGWKRGRRIFVCAHGDLFHEDVPDEWIDRVFHIMAMAPQHTFLVLTKRAERMRRYVMNAEMQIRDMVKYEPIAQTLQWPLPNVQLGVSFGRQVKAAERLYHLLQTPAALRWCSYEPALEYVNLEALQHAEVAFSALQHGIIMPHRVDWIVVGGESGVRARPFDIAWARKLVEQCRLSAVPAFVKQLGKVPFVEDPDSHNQLLMLRDSHGGDWDEWPHDLRIRQYPTRQWTP